MMETLWVTAFLSDWWFSILGYGVMLYVLIETAGDAIYASRIDRRLRDLHRELAHDYSLPSFAQNHHMLREEALDFDATYAQDAQDRLALWMNIAPLLGLLFTATQLAIALPTAFEVIQVAPEGFFRSVGVAVGSTAMGVLATILATIAAHRLTLSADGLRDMVGQASGSVPA